MLWVSLVCLVFLLIATARDVMWNRTNELTSLSIVGMTGLVSILQSHPLAMRIIFPVLHLCL